MSRQGDEFTRSQEAADGERRAVGRAAGNRIKNHPIGRDLSGDLLALYLD